jgi:mannose-6-phosphate isomerase-like protein (cupin superfamily)
MHVGPGEGRTRHVMSATQEVKAGEEAGLSFGMFVSTFPPGEGMPFLHLHRRHEEAFYVLEGELQFKLGDEEIHARPGSAILVPPGTPHCFRNIGDGDVRWLVITGPASGVTMIEEVATVTPGDIDGMAAFMERWDSELLERRPHWARS